MPSLRTISGGNPTKYHKFEKDNVSYTYIDSSGSLMVGQFSDTSLRLDSQNENY